MKKGGSGGSKGSESGGSESGGSAVDSITGEHNVSGRSSAYGDNAPETIPPMNTVQPRSETSSVGAPTTFSVSFLNILFKFFYQLSIINYFIKFIIPNRLSNRKRDKNKIKNEY